MTDSLKEPQPNDPPARPPESESTPARWAFINDWKVMPQENDRAPVFGVVAPNNAGGAAQRSAARRRHQASFKEWSRARGD